MKTTNKELPVNFGPLKGANANAKITGPCGDADDQCDGNCGSCSSKEEPYSFCKDKFNNKNSEKGLLKIKHKIAVLSGKGGVGKSTVAVNLAFALLSAGYKVGLMDMDIHGPSIPTMLNLEDITIRSDEEGIIPVKIGDLKVMSIGFFLENSADALIWRGPMKVGIVDKFLHEVKWGELDFLIIDLPPGTGDEPLSIGQALSSQDGAVIVTTPQEVANADVRKSINFCNKLGLSVLGIIENMSGFVCPHCNEVTQIFGLNGGKRLAKDFNIPFLGAIPLDPTIVAACDRGLPYMDVHTETNANTMTAFKQIIDSIVQKINAN